MAATARDKILGKLRAAREPFGDVPPVENKRHMVPARAATADELVAQFVAEAEALHCVVHEAASDSAAVETVMDILDGDQTALMWDDAHIPLHGLAAVFGEAGVQRAAINDGTTRVGITGVDAGLAATGSLVVVSGEGKSRQASLLPLVHVAVVKRDQIVSDIETFYGGLDRAALREHSNIAVISGPSKSADIAMELIHGMHGPGEVHIVLVP